MKIYTKTGDEGETGLFGGPRVRKDAARIEAIGVVDELSAVLGVARASGLPRDIATIIFRVQNQLFDLGAELATPVAKASGPQNITERQIEWLERTIDQHEAALPPLKEFILPGGTVAASHLQLARSICRRAERRVVTLSAEAAIGLEIIIYLNRLSDLLFVLARHVNQTSGEADVVWEKDI